MVEGNGNMLGIFGFDWILQSSYASSTVVKELDLQGLGLRLLGFKGLRV
jgi:hypothetical protein